MTHYIKTDEKKANKDISAGDYIITGENTFLKVTYVFKDEDYTKSDDFVICVKRVGMIETDYEL